MSRFPLNDYDWSAVERTKQFIRALYGRTPPGHPGCILHTASRAGLPPPPPGLDDDALAVWRFTETLRRTPHPGDQSVPCFGAGVGGTCLLASAFGGRERVNESGNHWLEPIIHDPSEVFRLKTPSLAEGAIGGMLERIGRLGALLDERVTISPADFQSPFTTAEQLLGSDLFFLMPYDAPKALHCLMDLLTDFSIRFFREQFKRIGPQASRGSWPGIYFPPEAGIQMSDDNMVNVSPEIYDEFVVPYNNRVSEAFGGLFLHSCVVKEHNLPSLGKIRGLRGVNTDISSSVGPRQFYDALGDGVVFAPHAYVNTETNFKSYADFARYALDGYRPGRRLFVYPCVAMYLPGECRDLPFNPGEVLDVLRTAGYPDMELY